MSKVRVPEAIFKCSFEKALKRARIDRQLLAEDVLVLLERREKITATLDEAVHAIDHALAKRDIYIPIWAMLELEEAAVRKGISNEFAALLHSDPSQFGLDEDIPRAICRRYGVECEMMFGFLDKHKPGIIREYDLKREEFDPAMKYKIITGPDDDFFDRPRIFSDDIVAMLIAIGYVKIKRNRFAPKQKIKKKYKKFLSNHVFKDVVEDVVRITMTLQEKYHEKFIPLTHEKVQDYLDKVMGHVGMYEAARCIEEFPHLIQVNSSVYFRLIILILSGLEGYGYISATNLSDALAQVTANKEVVSKRDLHVALLVAACCGKAASEHYDELGFKIFRRLAEKLFE